MPAAVSGQSLDRPGIALGQAGALGFRPALELHQARQVETVEKGPPVEGHRRGRVAAVHCRLKVTGIDRDGVGVEAEGARGADEDVLVKLLPQLEEGLLQVVAGPVGVAFGPEVGQQSVPAHSLFGAHGDQSEQRQRPLAGYGPCQRSFFVFDGETAEGPEPQHSAVVSLLTQV